MTETDRLALALQSGVLALPPEGRIAVLRAAPGPWLEVIPRERLACEQSFRPLHDALAAEGCAVSTRIEGPAAMAVVNLTRNRAETLANIARGLGMLPPGGRLAVAGSKTDGVDGIARQVGRVLPLEGAFVKAHGRVFWLARPEALPDLTEDWAREGRPSPNKDGFLTAPGIFSSEHPDPGSVKLAAAIGDTLKGRVADLGAGWGWLAQAVLAQSPAIEALDLYEAEAVALDCARLNVSELAGALPLGRRDVPRRRRRALRRGCHQSAVPPRTRRRPATRRRLHPRRRGAPEARWQVVHGRQSPAPLRGRARRCLPPLGEARGGRPLQGASRRIAPPAVTGDGTAAALREVLRAVAAEGGTLTYREAAERIGLAPPHVIQQVAARLEALMAEDAAAGNPFIAALVVSRGGAGLPAPGFFAAATRLGRYAGGPSGAEAADWHAAELARARAFHA